jgi:hypothetical protein
MESLTQSLTADAVRAFADAWFDRLSRHVPVEELLPMISDSDLEMIFPDATLSDHGQVRTWYAEIGRTYGEQSHVVERFAVRPGGEGADVDLSVVWRARKVADGDWVAFRAGQVWHVARESGEPVIQRYRVVSLDPIV